MFKYKIRCDNKHITPILSKNRCEKASSKLKKKLTCKHRQLQVIQFHNVFIFIFIFCSEYHLMFLQKQT